MKKRNLGKISVFAMLLVMALVLTSCVNTSYDGSLNIAEASVLEEFYLTGDEVILDARSLEDYEKGHLRNAVSLPASELVIDKPVAGTLAPKARVESELEERGITNDSVIYVYDSNGGVYASRVWWTLKVYGHENVYVVNGGADAIVDLGLELTKEVPDRAKSEYTASEADESMIADYDYVKSVSEDEESSVKIIDVRSIAEYEQGNIKGSILYPHTDNLYSDGTFKSARDTYLFYSDKGIKRDDEIILYCKTSFRAAQTLAVLQEAGYENVKVFDGAYLLWESEGGPVETEEDNAPVTTQDGS